MYIYLPNHVYNSIGVVMYAVFSYKYECRERDDVGACCNICLGLGCNTVTMEQIACIFGMNRAHFDTDTKVGM